jgi:hypothetical protein
MVETRVPILKGGRIFLPKLWIINKQCEDRQLDVNDEMLVYINELRDEFKQNEDKCALWFYFNFTHRMVYDKKIRTIHNRWWQSYLEDKDLQQSLDLLGIDEIDKKAAFFYLCVYAKFYAWTLTNRTIERTKSTRGDIESLIQHLDKLEPIISSTDSNETVIHNDEKIALILSCENEKKHVVDDAYTLYCIKMGLKNMIENTPKECEEFINSERFDYKKGLYRKSNVKAFLCYWFHKYVYWFLKKQKGRCDRWLIVSKMIYHIKLIDDSRFLYKKESKKVEVGKKTKTMTFGAQHLKGIISPALKEIERNPFPPMFNNIMWNPGLFYSIYQEGA